MAKANADIPDMQVAAIEAFCGFGLDVGDQLFFVLFQIDPGPHKQQHYQCQQNSKNS